MALDPRWRVIREFQSKGSDPAVVVQFVLPKPIWLRLVEGLDLAARVTGSPRVGAQFDALVAEAIAEWQQQWSG
jgi:hypothetical protein